MEQHFSGALAIKLNFWGLAYIYNHNEPHISVSAHINEDSVSIQPQGKLLVVEERKPEEKGKIAVLYIHLPRNVETSFLTMSGDAKLKSEAMMGLTTLDMSGISRAELRTNTLWARVRDAANFACGPGGGKHIFLLDESKAINGIGGSYNTARICLMRLKEMRSFAKVRGGVMYAPELPQSYKDDPWEMAGHLGRKDVQIVAQTPKQLARRAKQFEKQMSNFTSRTLRQLISR